MRRTRKKQRLQRSTISYLRCSTEEQTNGTSIEAQRSRTEQYAGAVGLELSEAISDPGWSAKNLQRPGMARILDMVESDTVGTVIILKLDRITRSIADLQLLLRLFERHDVRLVSVCESLDTASAAGRLVVNVLGTFAQFEREQTSERTALGLATKRRGGRAYGPVPFGWRRDGELLVPEPNEQEALTKVRAMYQQGVSYAKIGRWLGDAGFTPPQGGAAWHSASVRKMCLSRAFAEGVGLNFNRDAAGQGNDPLS